MRIARFSANDSIFTGVLQPDGESAQLIRGEPGEGDWNLTNNLVAVDRLLAPILPTDILCIGLNYHEHARETAATVPDNPMLFIKASNALGDPGSPILLPPNSSQVDFEGELVVVMKTNCRRVSKEQALDHVLGYTIGNDVSARDWQKDPKLNGGQFARGKSFDTFAPIGPWIVTPDQVGDPNRLQLTTRLNGQVMQQSSTADMIFDVATIISSLSQTMTIRAGSIIFTGTPSGVGVARKPQVFLKDGDVVEVEIERIGTLTNRVIAERVL